MQIKIAFKFCDAYRYKGYKSVFEDVNYELDFVDYRKYL